MPRTPALLAARIDRLALTAHRFHRFAHHPLCDEYAREVVLLGKRTRVCRGCLLVVAGGLSGALASVAFVAPPSVLVFLSALGFAGLIAALGRRAPGRARPPKLVSRFLPVLVLVYTLGRAVQLGTAGRGLAAAAVVVVFGIVALYRRRGPDRSPCASCPERAQLRPCRVIAPIVRRERAFRRLAGQWLARVDP
jgi:hypothetical protein